MLYTVENVVPGLTRIKDVALTSIYLIEGSERALLIDTGIGAGNLRELVESLTDKPYEVVITHGHVDHAAGTGAFARIPVYMSPGDIGLYGQHNDIELRQYYVRGTIKQGADRETVEGLTEADYIPALPADKLRPLTDGMSFSLGGVTAEIIAAAGHTQGSVAVLLPEWRILITGDACNQFTWLFLPESTALEAYRENLMRLKAITDGYYDRVLISHGGGEGVPETVEEVLEVCEEILAGTDDKAPFTFHLLEIHCAIGKKMDFSCFRRSDGKFGNVVYNPERLR